MTSSQSTSRGRETSVVGDTIEAREFQLHNRARIGIMDDVVSRLIMQNTTLSLLSMLGTFLAIALLPLSEASAQAPAEAPAEAPAPAEALAEAPAKAPAEAPAKARKLGGHLGLGVPIVTVGTLGTSVIGRDFGVTGITAGINLALTPKWSIDFEFIALGNFKPSGIPGPATSTTLIVLDPGVIYNAGFLFVGIRAAMRVPSPLGGAEFGVIPIIGKAFKINEYVAYYIELDLPTFAHSTGHVTFTPFIQTGFGF